MANENDKGSFNPFSAAKQATDQEQSPTPNKRSTESSPGTAPATSGPRAVIPTGLPSRPLSKPLSQEPPQPPVEQSHLETEHGIILASEISDEESQLVAENIDDGQSLVEQMAAFDMEHAAMYSEITDVSDLEAAAGIAPPTSAPSDEQEAMWAAQLAAAEEEQWAAQHAASQEAQWGEHEYQAPAPPPQPQRPDYNMDFDFNAGAPSKKSNLGLWITIVILVLALAGGAVYFLLFANKGKEDLAQAPAPEDQQEAPSVVALEPLPTSDIHIALPEGSTLFINGEQVQLRASGQYPIIKGQANQIIAYNEGSLPFVKVLQSGEAAEELAVNFESAEAYLKTKVALKLKDSAKAQGLSVSFDGTVLSELPAEIKDVVLGFPHHIIVQKEGLGSALHLIYPDEQKTVELEIPELVDFAQAQKETLVTTEIPINRSKPYKIAIQTLKHLISTSGDIVVAKQDLLNIKVSREQRKDLNYILNPTNFGSVHLSFSLNTESLGTADVSFIKAKKVKNVGICFRRVGEVLCPDMEAKSEIPSGDWEIMGYTVENEEKSFLRGNFTQPLKMGYAYEFVAASTKNDFFEMGVKSEAKRTTQE